MGLFSRSTKEDRKKPLHPMGIVVTPDGMPKYFLVTEMSVPGKANNEPSASKKLTPSEWYDAVSDGQVQYFNCIDGKTVVDYSEAETAYLKKKNIPLLQGDDYYRNEAIFVDFGDFDREETISFSCTVPMQFLTMGRVLYVIATSVYCNSLNAAQIITPKLKSFGSVITQQSVYMFMWTCPLETLVKCLVPFPSPISVNIAQLAANSLTQDAPKMQKCVVEANDVSSMVKYLQDNFLSRQEQLEKAGLPLDAFTSIIAKTGSVPMVSLDYEKLTITAKSRAVKSSGDGNAISAIKL